MEHDDLINSLIATSDPDDALATALIENIRERKKLFKEMLEGSRFLPSGGRAADGEPYSGALQ